MADKDQPDFWRKLKAGSIITLSDQQTLEESVRRGQGVQPRDYVVDQVLDIRHIEGFAEWLLIRMQDEDDEQYLVIKIVDNSLEARVFFEPGEDVFQPGTREDMISSGDFWLFQEPENPEQFEFDKLQFADSFNWTFLDDQDEEVEVEYQIKQTGVLYADAVYRPSQEGLRPMFATWIEYKSAEDVPNPEAVIMELGGEEKEEGGWITVMFGCKVNLTEIDVLEVTN